ncbi:MAG: transposase [Oscillospiraceae bacterium]|nr:transposase [Oscillospiraceae bacterium]
MYHITLTVTFPQPNKGYTQFYPSQNQECLLEGLKRVFGHIGSVPPRLKFDKLSTTVVKVLADGEREVTEGFTRFRLHFVRSHSSRRRRSGRVPLVLSPCREIPRLPPFHGFPGIFLHHIAPAPAQKKAPPAGSALSSQQI